MVRSVCSKQLDDPKPFYHSHATGLGNIYITSGMVSRKTKGSDMNIGVSYCEDSKAFKHNIDLQFNDIVSQLEVISAEIGISSENLRDSIIDVRVFIVNVKEYFQDFNKAYGKWIGDRNNYPSRTTIGVDALPSNVVLEIAFTLGIQ